MSSPLTPFNVLDGLLKSSSPTKPSFQPTLADLEEELRRWHYDVVRALSVQDRVKEAELDHQLRR
jgi:hypothetical protein